MIEHYTTLVKIYETFVDCPYLTQLRNEDVNEMPPYTISMPLPNKVVFNK